MTSSAAKPGERVIRPLGTSERLSWLYDRVSCTDFFIAAHLTRTPSVDALRAALERAGERCPLLRTTIAVVRRRPVLVALGDRAVEIDRVELERSEHHAWSTRELERRFEEGAPPLRITVLRDPTEDGCTLVLTFRHAVIDGASAAVLFQEITADALGIWTPSEGQRPISRAQESLFPLRLRARLLAIWALLLLLLTEVGMRLALGARRQLPPLAKTRQQPRKRSSVLRRTLDTAATTALLDRCRAERTTVTAVLVAAQVRASRALFDRGGPVTLGVNVAADLRGTYAEPVDPLSPGFYISLVPTDARVTGAEDLWELARTIRGRFVKRFERGAAHLFWTMFPPAFLLPPNDRGARRVDSMMRMAPKMSVASNVGRIDLPGTEALGDALDQITFAMAPQTACPFVVTAASHADRLTVTLTHNPDALPVDLAEQVFERLVESLCQRR